MGMDEVEVPQLPMMPKENSLCVKCKFLSNEIPGPLVVKGFLGGLIMKNYPVTDVGIITYIIYAPW